MKGSLLTPTDMSTSITDALTNAFNHALLQQYMEQGETATISWDTIVRHVQAMYKRIVGGVSRLTR
mgnify:CR=1 FL=1